MANIIAVIWDCDKTLIDGYMQDPIFKDYNINASDFWKEVNSKPDEYKKKGIRVNKDTYYLNHFIKCAHDGTLKGLNNAKLKEYGKNRSSIKVFRRYSKKRNKCLRMIRLMQNMGFK